MTLHLVDIEELCQSVRNTHSRSYLNESISSYRAGAYRASIITTWIAICVDIMEKVRELSLAGDAAAAAIAQRMEKIQPNDPQGMLAFERDILKFACEDLQFISQIEKTHLERVKQDRNVCAHPTFNLDNGQYSPSAEIARAYIVQASNYLLIQAPVKGKVVVDLIYELIHEKSFPEDDEKAFVILSSDTYLGRAKESVSRNLTIVLLKRLFTEGEVIPREQFSRIAAALGAIGRINHDVYDEVISERLSPILEQASDKILRRAIPFFARRADSWRKLDQALIVRLHRLIEVMSSKDLILYDVSALCMVNPEVNKFFQRLMDGFGQEKIESILIDKPSPIHNDRVVSIFLASSSFAVAVRLGTYVVIPYAQFFHSSDIERLLQGVFANNAGGINQILSAGGIEHVFTQFYEVTKESLSKHGDVWLQFWKNANAAGHHFDDVRVLLERDGFLQSSTKPVSDDLDFLFDDDIPF